MEMVPLLLVFITGANTTGSATTVLAMDIVSTSDTTAKEGEAPLPYCDILFWDSGLGGGGGMGNTFKFIWIRWTLLVSPSSPRM